MRDLLRQSPLFVEASPSQLQWIVEHGSEVRVAAGDVLFAEGDPDPRFYILLEGELVITKRLDGQEMTLATHHPGAFTGEIPLLAGTPYVATARAGLDSRLLSLDPAVFEEMIARCPATAHLILRTMAQRIQTTESVVREREKLAALGKLSAGLAHELNNPAAAARRAAGQLRTALADLLAAEGDNATELLAGRPKAVAVPLDPLARSDREEEIAAWLEVHGVDGGWDLAPAVVSAGLEVADLASYAAAASDRSLGAALRRASASATVGSLLDLLEGSTGRIAALIGAIKNYSYMDQAPLQEIDVHAGLESTLAILQHRLSGIQITRRYDPDLPRITAYGGELNQVWTNLLDNAIDALDDRGHIEIRTAREGDRVLVEIADDGAGIPAEIQARIFEPFFTTKGVGEGTGLGLDISYRIVVGHHHGEIALASRPGETRFTVRLPFEQPRQESRT